jgi:hypothetical protein
MLRVCFGGGEGGVAQLVGRRRAVRQARVWFSARLPREAFPTELISDEKMERNHCKWRRMNILYECDGMNVCSIKYTKNKKSGIIPPTL